MFGHGVPILPKGDPQAEKPEPRLHLDNDVHNDEAVIYLERVFANLSLILLQGLEFSTGLLHRKWICVQTQFPCRIHALLSQLRLQKLQSVP